MILITITNHNHCSKQVFLQLKFFTDAKVMGSIPRDHASMNKCNWEKSTTDDANLFSSYSCGWIGCVSNEL